MKKILLYINLSLAFSCNNSGQDISGINTITIFSQQYNLDFTIEKTILDSVEIKIPEKISGNIRRHNNYLYSKSSEGFGILEDSLCLYVDDFLKIVTLDGPLSLLPKLVSDFHDPLAIFYYASKFNNAYSKKIQGEVILHDYRFPSDTIPVRHILITENKKDSSLLIEFTYELLGDIIKDIISYKINYDPVNHVRKNIKDFIEEKNGKYATKQQLKGYTFFDGTLLKSLFEQ